VVCTHSGARVLGRPASYRSCSAETLAIADFVVPSVDVAVAVAADVAVVVPQK
jgi:hypothetical protein